MTVTMQNYITIDQVVKTDAARTALNRLIESGIIEAIKINNQIAIPENAMELLHLVGKPIRITEAAQKYDINQPTLSRWADNGYIRTIEQRYSYRTLDEADVKRAVTIYKQALNETGSTHQAGWKLRRAMTKQS